MNWMKYSVVIAFAVGIVLMVLCGTFGCAANKTSADTDKKIQDHHDQAAQQDAANKDNNELAKNDPTGHPGGAANNTTKVFLAAAITTTVGLFLSLIGEIVMEVFFPEFILTMKKLIPRTVFALLLSAAVSYWIPYFFWPAIGAGILLAEFLIYLFIYNFKKIRDDASAALGKNSPAPAVA